MSVCVVGVGEPLAGDDGAARRPVSSHGVDTLTAIEIGRALAAGVRFPPVTLLTIAIEPPTRFTSELSPAAQAGLERALERAVAWIWGPQQK